MEKEQPYQLEPVAKLTLGDNGLLPDLMKPEYAALKADIKKNGVFVPISIDEKYIVIDGHHRLRACIELGIENVPTRMHSPLDPTEKQDLALRLNLNRRNLTREQKRNVIEAVLVQDQGSRSDRVVADAIGVDHCPEWYGTLESRREEAEAKVEEARRLVAEAERVVLEAEQMGNWLDRFSGESALSYVPYSDMGVSAAQPDKRLDLTVNVT